MNLPDTCGDYYNCCNCGGENCGCTYCFSCNACEYCQTGEGEHCEMISEAIYKGLTQEQKALLAR